MKFGTTKRDKPNDLKILVFGASGVGKTSLVKTLPCKDEEVLVISTEVGNEVLRSNNFALYLRDRDIELKELFMSLYKKHSFKWIIWDSISDWSDKALELVVKNCPVKEKNNSFYKWGELKNTVTKWNKVFLNVPNCHKLCISSAKDDPETGKMRFLMQGSAKDSIGFYYDEIYALRVIKQGEDIIRQIVTNNDGYYECKSRMSGGSQIPLDLYEEANLTKLFNKCYKENK